MHVPDGFLDLPTSAATGVTAVAAVGMALRALGREQDDRWPVRAGLTGAFVFAAQMVNFPVGAGTSGHLIGAALASTLLGPAAAVVVMASVITVQGLVFADGGLTAMGTNIVLMAVVPVLVAYAVQRLTLRDHPSPRAMVTAAAAGALLSVPVAALVFCGLYLVGGAVPVPAGALVATMLGVHAVIGAGEAVITGLCLSAVLAARPDLIAAARVAPGGSGRLGRQTVAWVSLGLALAVAAGLSLLASSFPDGLEHTAGRLGFGAAAEGSASTASPVADYAVPALGALGGSVAGVLGVVLTLGAVVLLLALLGRGRAAGAALRELAPEAKLLGALGIAAVVVAAPLRAWPVLAVAAAGVLLLLVVAGPPLRWILGRLLVLLPFLAIAVVLPFVASGPRCALGVLTYSCWGAQAAGVFAVRCLLAFGIALVLAWTTHAADLAASLARLHVPGPIVLTLNLMLRYLGVLGDDLHRQSVARASRGDGRGTAGRWAASAAGVGHLFVRSYERGERVHLAMVSRGYAGAVPATATPTPVRHWGVALAPALILLLLTWGLR